MLKQILKRLGLSAGCAAVLTGLNYLVYLLTGSIIGVSIAGGECIETVGGGLYQLDIYAMSVEGEGGGMSTRLGADPASFLMMAAVIFVILTVVEVLRKKKPVR